MSAAALLLLPGLLSTRVVFAPQIAAFGTEREIVIPDFRGLDSFEAMADAALALAPPAFAVAGHSMGGRVALEMFRRAPERIERIALMSTGVHPVAAAEAGPWRMLVTLAEHGGMTAAVRRWLPPMLHPRHRENRELIAAIEAMWNESTPDIFARQIRATLNRHDLRPLLPEIACPALVMCGAEDNWSTPAQHEAIAAATPGARLAIIPDCGHMLTLEAPEKVNDELRRWLNA